jgi:hypothetical protein
MLFRIVAPHTHRAVLSAGTFTCVRIATPTDEGLSIAWEVYRGDTLLKGDCRTLNEAKKLCRSVSSGLPSPS